MRKEKKTVPITDISPELIYDGKSFYPVFSHDITTTKREMLIVCPFMRINRLRQITKLLSEALLNGAAVTVITRPPEDYRTEKEQETAKSNADYLRGYGVNVVFKSGFHQKYAIIDQSIVWYGSVNFLSFGSNDESVMRLESSNIAGKLTDAVMG